MVNLKLKTLEPVSYSAKKKKIVLKTNRGR